jgi:hypothetical protein
VWELNPGLQRIDGLLFSSTADPPVSASSLPPCCGC